MFTALPQYQPPEGVRSVGDHVELEIRLYLERFPPQQRHLRRLVFDYLLKRECCITGCHSMREVDLLNIGSYTELPGGNISLPNGYSSILQPICKNIPPENIVKQKPVARVVWGLAGEEEEAGSDCSADTVLSNCNAAPSSFKGLCQASLPASAVTSRRGSQEDLRAGRPAVRVECEDGSCYHADQVICTVPLGILTRQPGLFQPPLPQDKTDSMGRMVFGVVDKIFLAYDKPFLNPDISEIITLWNKKDEAQVPMSERWYRKIYSFCKGKC